MPRFLVTASWHLILAWSALLASSVAAEDLVVRPQPKPGSLDNPLKGWCPYTDAGVIQQPYCPALEKSTDELFLERSEELVRQLGYEFQVTELAHPARVKSKQSARLSLKGRNLGVAPFYYPWSVEWALLDSSGKVKRLFKTAWDIRAWTPGEFAEDVTPAFDVPVGKYRLALGVRDPWQDQPAIRFANDLPVIDGWTILSALEVTP